MDQVARWLGVSTFVILLCAGNAVQAQQKLNQPYVMVIHPSLPVGSVKELIAYAKNKPGVIN